MIRPILENCQGVVGNTTMYPCFLIFQLHGTSVRWWQMKLDRGCPVVVIVCRELRSAVFSRRLARSTHPFPLSFHDRPRNGQCPKALRNTVHGLSYTPTIGRRMLYTLLSFAGTWRYIIHVGFLCSRFFRQHSTAGCRVPSAPLDR